MYGESLKNLRFQVIFRRVEHSVIMITNRVAASMIRFAMNATTLLIFPDKIK